MKSRTLIEKSYQAIEEAALTCPRVGIAYLCWSASFENVQPRVADFRWRLTSEASVGFAFFRRHPIKNGRSCSQCCSWMLGVEWEVGWMCIQLHEREDSAPSRKRRLQYGITPHRFSAFTALHDMVSKHKIRLSHAIDLLDRGTAMAGHPYQWRR
ncbi:hypothetical protein HBH56_232390 [Parastagonospora nodorum]|uniref:Uncharacterized protein n=1 Tax=Phaeosphaeria nodorum (strain SN15 / ATCC MYA-4574 / FGSC 10173) TaxID=321614 RepID=A0A7U2NRH7_PHANO|nr:hypothetical protein HBH56_232390 [Parastagonospora nodorum]QRD07739.1 hypothetical protein JI435_162100 [Parastagonospora nodorum SN15]KAH3921396.1 hypothetical protein HBH54_240690 [Parastagonospora nodorum]KAH4125467.1 hypothetical protein HBH45_231800 [Parastagonospora nodorum]KAH4147753.1 hypothetical protein HBH44_219460 [Parastagonospora nodorum]